MRLLAFKSCCVCLQWGGHTARALVDPLQKTFGFGSALAIYGFWLLLCLSTPTFLHPLETRCCLCLTDCFHFVGLIDWRVFVICVLCCCLEVAIYFHHATILLGVDAPSSSIPYHCFEPQARFVSIETCRFASSLVKFLSLHSLSLAPSLWSEWPSVLHVLPIWMHGSTYSCFQSA